jgi:hypothetical protein
MVENDILKQTAAHHERRRTRNSPRHTDSDGANSNVPEVTHRDNQHHDEEKPHKERNTNMTKRTKRTKAIFSGLTLLFVFSLSASAANIENREEFRNEARAFIDAEVARRDASFNKNEIRFAGRQFRTDKRQETRFMRDINAFEFRVESRSRTFNRTDAGSRLERFDNQRTKQENIARNNRQQNRRDRELANRFKDDRDARDFVAVQRNLSGADFALGNDREGRLDGFNS